LLIIYAAAMGASRFLGRGRATCVTVMIKLNDLRRPPRIWISNSDCILTLLVRINNNNKKKESGFPRHGCV